MGNSKFLRIILFLISKETVLLWHFLKYFVFNHPPRLLSLISHPILKTYTHADPLKHIYTQKEFPSIVTHVSQYYLNL